MDGLLNISVPTVGGGGLVWKYHWLYVVSILSVTKCDPHPPHPPYLVYHHQGATTNIFQGAIIPNWEIPLTLNPSPPPPPPPLKEAHPPCHGWAGWNIIHSLDVMRNVFDRNPGFLIVGICTRPNKISNRSWILNISWRTQISKHYNEENGTWTQYHFVRMCMLKENMDLYKWRGFPSQNFTIPAHFHDSITNKLNSIPCFFLIENVIEINFCQFYNPVTMEIIPYQPVSSSEIIVLTVCTMFLSFILPFNSI